MNNNTKVKPKSLFIQCQELVLEPPTADELYRKYAAEISASLKKAFGAGPPESDDVVQEAFAKYFSLKDTSHVLNPRAFLYKTARNIIIDHKRAQKHLDAYISETLEGAGAQRLEEITPERVLLQKDRFQTMREAITCLPEKQKMVLKMSRIEGRTYAEISAATGWSLADISRQMTSGLEALHEALERVKKKR